MSSLAPGNALRQQREGIGFFHRSSPITRIPWYCHRARLTARPMVGEVLGRRLQRPVDLTSQAFDMDVQLILGAMLLASSRRAQRRLCAPRARAPPLCDRAPARQLQNNLAPRVKHIRAFDSGDRRGGDQQEMCAALGVRENRIPISMHTLAWGWIALLQPVRDAAAPQRFAAGRRDSARDLRSPAMPLALTKIRSNAQRAGAVIAVSATIKSPAAAAARRSRSMVRTRRTHCRTTALGFSAVTRRMQADGKSLSCPAIPSKRNVHPGERVRHGTR
jgi:hypothetical protein